MDITISPLTEQDIPMLLSLIRELADYEKLSHRVSATEESLKRDLIGVNPYAEALIARLNGLPVGYALFFHSYSTFMAKRGVYLEDVYVQPAARACGVGKALFLAVAQVARERNCGRLEFSVLDWNQPSIDFYISRGAEPLSDWTMYRLDEEAIAKLTEACSPRTA
jgi:GNAT superfamily N-acetyltransferase